MYCATKGSDSKTVRACLHIALCLRVVCELTVCIKHHVHIFLTFYGT